MNDSVLLGCVPIQTCNVQGGMEVHNNAWSINMLDFQEEDMLKRLKRYFNFYKHEAHGAASKHLWPVLGFTVDHRTSCLLCAHVVHDHHGVSLYF